MRKREAEAGAKKMNKRIGWEVVSVYPVGRGWGVGVSTKTEAYPDGYAIFNCNLDDIKVKANEGGGVTFTLPATVRNNLKFFQLGP